jgi:hypothetical protein
LSTKHAVHAVQALRVLSLAPPSRCSSCYVLLQTQCADSASAPAGCQLRPPIRLLLCPVVTVLLQAPSIAPHSPLAPQVMEGVPPACQPGLQSDGWDRPSSSSSSSSSSWHKQASSLTWVVVTLPDRARCCHDLCINVRWMAYDSCAK